MKSIYNSHYVVTSESFAGCERMDEVMRDIGKLLRSAYDNGYDIAGVESELMSAIVAEAARIRILHGIDQRKSERELVK